MNSKSLIVAVAGLVLTIGAAGVASAQDVAPHPRRAEVNQRLETQDRRIDEAKAKGEISPMKAHRLHRADRRIARAERRDAKVHHGRITRAEQARLNHREDKVGRRIG
jgi:hypothetical protein